MKCPFCQNVETRVIDSRPVEDGAALRRRRLCESCEGRFTTHERYQNVPLMVVKRDGRREEFSADKLRSGLIKACSKRPVATDTINEATRQIEQALRAEAPTEVPVDAIGEMVMERLFTMDEVAYVRFASVYQQFDNVRRFAQILDRFNRRGRAKAPQVRDKDQEPAGEAFVAEADVESDVPGPRENAPRQIVSGEIGSKDERAGVSPRELVSSK